MTGCKLSSLSSISPLYLPPQPLSSVTMDLISVTMDLSLDFSFWSPCIGEIIQYFFLTTTNSRFFNLLYKWVSIHSSQIIISYSIHDCHFGCPFLIMRLEIIFKSIYISKGHTEKFQWYIIKNKCAKQK